MSKNVKFSIITPSYNQGKYIEKTIKYVIEQGYPNLEYFIFDGGSTDNSVNIIKKYAKKYPGIIRWESKNDKGQVDALNKGLKQATGDIIAYLNSDDYYLPDSFNQVVKMLNPNKPEWLVGNCLVSKKNLKWTFTLKHIWPVNYHPFFLEVFNTINQPSVFLTKKLVNKVGLFDKKLNYTFDYDYWLRCVRVTLPKRTSRNLSVFRIHSNSKGSSQFNKQFEEDLLVTQKRVQNPLAVSLHRLGFFITTILYRILK